MLVRGWELNVAMALSVGLTKWGLRHVHIFLSVLVMCACREKFSLFLAGSAMPQIADCEQVYVVECTSVRTCLTEAVGL